MCVCACVNVLEDFHVNYHSLKCDHLATFVYHVNQSVLLSSLRAGVTASHGGVGSTVGPPQRRQTTAQERGRLADACAAVQAFDEHNDDSGGGDGDCLRESSLLFLLLMLGTVWLGLSLYNFTKTSVLTVHSLLAGLQK